MTDIDLICQCAEAIGLKYVAVSYSGGLFGYKGYAWKRNIVDFNPLLFPEQAAALDPDGLYGDKRHAFCRRMAVRATVDTWERGALQRRLEAAERAVEYEKEQRRVRG